MLLTASAILALAAQCAPAVAPTTMLAVVRAESGFDPMAIGVNAAHSGRLTAATKEAAIAKSHQLIAAGANLDLGLAQINSRNLGWLGLTVEAAFDPCQNLRAAARVLQAGYALGDPDRAGQQQALRIAFSYYNTGRADRGFANGYVARVTGEAGTLPKIVPAIAADPAPAWDVFAGGGRATAAFVIDPQASGNAR